MSNHAGRIAASLGTDHLTLKIPWSTPPYGPKPGTGAPIEGLARDARYSILFEAMNSSAAEAIAVGHHADDQAETFLMRIAKGTSILGLRCMRPARRFGMGEVQNGKPGWFGHVGMNRWIVRPLLRFSKDRILATCQANKLDYVTDPTNFQPDLTLRNTLRYNISQKLTGIERDSLFSEDLEKLYDNARALGISLDMSAGPEHLRDLVDHHVQTVTSMEIQAYRHLTTCILPSPPSSILLSADKISHITNSSTRLSMVKTILRYVSPHPWGSLRAEAWRKSSSFNTIISKLWTPNNFQDLKPFTCGSAVLWTPVYINSKGEIKMEHGPYSSQGWLATRLPPYRTRTTDTLHIDIPNPYPNQKIYNRTQTQSTQVLYDNRFLITIDWLNVPEQISNLLALPNTNYKLMVLPLTKYYLPYIILRSSSMDQPDIVLGTLYYSEVEASGAMDGIFKDAPWAHWEFVRNLSD